MMTPEDLAQYRATYDPDGWQDTLRRHPSSDGRTQLIVGASLAVRALCAEVEADATALQALREERDKLRAALRDVLARFSEPGHPGRDCLRTGWTPVEQVKAWLALVDGEAPDVG